MRRWQDLRDPQRQLCGELQTGADDRLRELNALARPTEFRRPGPGHCAVGQARLAHRLQRRPELSFVYGSRQCWQALPPGRLLGQRPADRPAATSLARVGFLHLLSRVPDVPPPPPAGPNLPHLPKSGGPGCLRACLGAPPPDLPTQRRSKSQMSHSLHISPGRSLPHSRNAR